MTSIRIGLGVDLHPPDASRPLVLGGVAFEGHDGLAGHSDGDAVCHALADALLGAAAMGDVGEHFPDSDPSLSGIDGPTLLRRTMSLVASAGGHVVNCDLTVVCHDPAIAPRRDEMRAALAEAMGIGLDGVSVKATRPEGLGISGEGVGCIAVALIER